MQNISENFEIFPWDRNFETGIEIIDDQHKKLVAGFNKSQMSGAGWIASPAGRELTESEAGEIFDKLGAWD